MTLTNSHHAYLAEYSVLDSALAKPLGVRVPFPTWNEAVTYRHRLNHARMVDRSESTRTYAPGDPGYAKSLYDRLIFRVRNIEGKLFVYIEHNRPPTGIEDIPGDELTRDELPIVFDDEPTLED